jgi:hypothetical protein
MSFSAAQHYKYYRPLIKRAWLAECEQHGQAPNDKEAYEDWYRAELLASELHVSSTTQCNQTADFDALMLHFAILVNDDDLIERFTRGGERRLDHVLKEALADLSWLHKQEFTWEYVRAIHAQSKRTNLAAVPERLEDCPPYVLYKLNQFLEEYIQRICKGYGIRRREVPELHRAGRSLEASITAFELPGQVQQLLPF